MKSLSPSPKTPWQDLAPQTRLLCTLISVFAIALTPHGQWLTWGIYGIGLFILVLISRVSLRQLLSKVMIEFAFVGVVLLGTLFRREGEVIWSWGILQITTTGVIILGSVTIKVILCLFAVNILILTTPIPQLFQGLLALKTPPLLVAIMASMYRYIGVLIEEVTTMKRAAMSRNMMINRGTIRYVMGNAIGSLFIRTYDRGERIHQAMLARGYQGIPPVKELPPYQPKDRMALILTSIMVILGQIS